MKFFKLFFIALFSFNNVSYSQIPQVSDPQIQVASLMSVKPYAVRIAKNPVDQQLYYITYTGNIYKILINGSNYTDTLVATATQHNINYLQGMLFVGNTLYLVGNRKAPNTAGHGLVMAGQFQGNGTWLWDTLMYTANYPSTATLFDHAFAGICLSAGGDSLFISSGSRTDHGEVQTSGGLFPNTREVPLTSKIFCIPRVSPTTIYIPNDSAVLATSPFVYSRGVRNTFDMALASNGDLIGTENSGDRDDPEELNWIRKSNHYGFPWRMGGNATGMQFATYNQNNDLLINHNSLAWTSGFFYNDPAYPQVGNTVLTEPIRNYGPDADKFRDPVTAAVRDASDEGTYITSFTSHRSPLGLVFDNGSQLNAPYTNGAFMLSYTEGTAGPTGTLPNGSIGPFNDTGQDLLHLVLSKDVNGLYSMNCYRIAWDFKNPVDAYLDNNNLYIIESHYPNNPIAPKLYKLTFPVNTNSNSTFLPGDTTLCSGSSITLIPNITGQNQYLWSTGATTAQITVSPTSSTSYWLRVTNGLVVKRDTINVTVQPLPTTPSAISVSGGSAKVCPGNTRTYTTGLTQGVTYDWDVPVGAVINSGQGTRSINVSYNNNFTSNGVITVLKTNACGSSSARSLNVNRNLPPTPSTINGPNYGLCSSQNTIYSVNAVSGISYTWVVPGGGTIVNGQGTNSISVNFPSSNFTGTLSVRGNNSCGLGNARNLTVRAVPSAPVSINGAQIVCPNALNIPYTITPVVGATNYTWTAPTGALITANGITSGSNVLTTTATNVTVKFANVTSTSTMRARANNSCGNGSVRTLQLQPCGFRNDEADIANQLQVISENPASDFILLSNVKNDLNIYNALGENVYHQFINSNDYENLNISITNFPDGIYIIRSGESTIRFIKH